MQRLRIAIIFSGKISDKLGEILKDIYVPENIAFAIVDSIGKDRKQSEAQRQQQLNQVQQQIAALRSRMNRVYEDNNLASILENGRP